jgi:hypothetical protein
MSTNNEIEITISDKKDSNDCNSDETIHTNEVPLNPIESSFSKSSINLLLIYINSYNPYH